AAKTWNTPAEAATCGTGDNRTGSPPVLQATSAYIRKARGPERGSRGPGPPHRGPLRCADRSTVQKMGAAGSGAGIGHRRAGGMLIGGDAGGDTLEPKRITPGPRRRVPNLPDRGLGGELLPRHGPSADEAGECTMELIGELCRRIIAGDARHPLGLQTVPGERKIHTMQRPVRDRGTPTEVPQPRRRPLAGPFQAHPHRRDTKHAVADRL